MIKKKFQKSTKKRKNSSKKNSRNWPKSGLSKQLDLLISLRNKKTSYREMASILLAERGIKFSFTTIYRYLQKLKPEKLKE